MSLLSHLCGHVQQYNVIELLCDCGYDMNLDFFPYSCSRETDWSRCESSWYPYE